MVRALLTAAGGTVAERADVLPTAAKLGVSNSGEGAISCTLNGISLRALWMRVEAQTRAHAMQLRFNQWRGADHDLANNTGSHPCK